MAVSYVNVPEGDFSLGIDARSAENQVAPGFVADLLNGDIIEKKARKRAGYQGYAGNLPIRVMGLTYVDSTNQVCFDLDTSIDLGSLRSTPIVVYGRSNTFSGGPFLSSGDTVKYYQAFTVPTKKTMVATATPAVIPIPEDEHGIATTNMFIDIAESTSQVDRSYQTALPNTITINESTFNIDIGYQNNTGNDKDIYVYYKDRSAITGESYIATLNHTGSGSETFTIPVGTHGLANFNIVAQIQQDLGATRQIVKANNFTIANNGDISVTLVSSSAATFYVILSIADINQQVTGNVGGNSTGTVIIPAIDSPYVFYGVYLTDVSNNQELVYADTIDYADNSKEVTISFTNNSVDAKNFTVFYLYGSTRSNQLCVTDTSVTTDSTDDSPQLTIWGLNHQLYASTAEDRAGWVNFIDSYRSAGEQRLISGLGGNLFAAKSYSEAGTSYAYAALLPSLFARTSGTTILGPLFYKTGDTPARTRGYITGNDSGTNWVKISAVSYDSLSGYTKYTLSIPGKSIKDKDGNIVALSSVLSTTTNLEDWLTISDMGYARFNGTFKIKQAVDGTNQIDLYVVNDSVDTNDYDDANCSGEGAIFTDQITWTADSPFIPDDKLSNAGFGDSFITVVKSSLDQVSVIDGLTDVLSMATGIATVGSRTNSVMPLRTSQPSATGATTNLVAGDMLTYGTSDINWDDRLLRAVYINSDTDRSIDITGDGTSATVTLLSGDTSYLAIGNSVTLTNAGAYTGTVTITDIPSIATFTFDNVSTVMVTGANLLGNTVQLDESFTWADTVDDTNDILVESRWIPIEHPDDSYDLTTKDYPRYFTNGSYDNQDFIRSTMVVNNSYLTNYADAKYKFDGVNNYRSGLPAWQPGLFITLDTGATAKIVANNPTATPSAFADGIFTLVLGNEQKFTAGQQLRHSYTGGFDDYVIDNIYDNGTNGFVKIVRTKTSTLGAAPAITALSIRRYYFRLNAVDINNNVTASAITGYQDHVAVFAADAAINIKGVGLPVLDNYDYDRLEVEIYGAKLNTSAPFYKITTLPLSFNNTEGYFNYTDSFADTDLIDLDTVSTALKGSELGITWQEPLRAKYVTSLGNSLVIGNVKDYSQIDLSIIASGEVGNSTFTDKIYTLRKDNTDIGSVTNMVDRVRYQTVLASGATAVTAAAGSAGVSFTVTAANTAVAGDWCYLFWSSIATTGRSLTYAGWWQIASATGADFTINFTGAAAGILTTLVPDKVSFATDSTDFPVVLDTDGNLGMANGDSFDLFDLGRRLSMAINASMRMVDTSITGMDSFSPWMVARGGNDTGKAGRVIIRQPKALSTTMELELPSSFGTNVQMFVNGVKRTANNQISALTRLYPSRILVSYENYPEIFDNPNAVLDADSDSAIDINSADGQEITGILPFFGEAAFGAAQQSAILVVFKTNSIYLVDVNEKRAGRNAVQRIETEGLGCTAPYSIAVTKNGIIYANNSGMYCLRRDQTGAYIGRYMERLWEKVVNLDQLAIMQGHHYGIGRSYKLSVPLVGEAANSTVYNYNHTGEDQGKGGSWSRYDNHPATGWANLGSDAFFGSTEGRVYSIRNKGTETDFRDDNEAINFVLDTRALDFGNAGIRKVADRAIVNYRTTSTSVGTSVYFSVDLNQEFSLTTALTIPYVNSLNGIGDQPNKSIYQVTHNTSRRRGTYHQLRIVNNSLDEGPEIAGIDFRVGGLTAKGIISAAKT